jgi:uncharacterized FAD-dependent dehydrogenase
VTFNGFLNIEKLQKGCKMTIGIIGSGVSGLFAALRLKYSGMTDVLLFEKEKIGGIAFSLPIRLSKSPAGTGLIELLGMNYLSLENQVHSMWSLLIESDLNFPSNQNDCNWISENLLEKSYSSLSLSRMQMRKALNRILSELDGLNIIRKEVIQLRFKSNSWIIECEDHSSYKMDSIIIAVGRRNVRFINQHIKSLQLLVSDPRLEIGIRVEVPLVDLSEGYIGKNKDRKIIWKPLDLSVSEFRTYCWVLPGRTISYQNNDLRCVEGVEDSKSKFLSFGLELRQYKISNEKLNAIINEIKDRQNSIFKGNIVVQQIEDFMENKEYYNSAIRTYCSLKGSILGNIEDLIGKNLSTLLREAIIVFEKYEIIPKHTVQSIVVAPHLGRCFSPFRLDSKMQTSVPRLFAIGDCTGLYRGVFQASLAGWAIGEYLI